MVICHSIAVGEELQFVKFLRKVTGYSLQNPGHAMAKVLLGVYGQANFDECDDLVHISSVKVLFSEALKFAIDRARDVVAFDLIQYSKQLIFQLTITEHEQSELIKNEWFTIIEKLVCSSCLITQNETNQVDIEQLL